MLLLQILIIYFGVILTANLPLVREGTQTIARRLDMKVYVLVPFWPVYLIGCTLALALLANVIILFLLGTLILYGHQVFLILSGKEPDWTPFWDKP